jgi:hypothetical protein
MALIRRIRATLGVKKDKIPDVLARAQAMYDGMNADKATYVSPNPGLTAFLLLLQQNLATYQQAAKARTIGAAAARDVQRDLLWTAMEMECTYVQTLCDATPGRATSLIQNAGLVVVSFPVRNKDLLTLKNGAESGTVACYANVGMLLGALVTKPAQHRFFNWTYTLDGGKTFLSLPPTTHPETLITGLPPATMVGVRVNLNTGTGPGEWSPMVSIQAH